MIKFVNYEIVFQEIPHKISLAINISNCQNKCDGCHSPSLRDDIGEELTNDILTKLIDKNDGIDCVVFMGEGKDKQRLIELAKLVASKNLLVALYSGSNVLDINYIPLFDYIKIGAYIPEFGGLNSLKTNQRLYKIDKGELNDITHLIWNHLREF